MIKADGGLTGKSQGQAVSVSVYYVAVVYALLC